MRSVFIVALVLVVPFARAAEPRLTKEMGVKIREGQGTMTEEQVLKLVPGPVKVTRAPDGADWLFTWEDLTSIEVILIDGKVVSSTGQFTDAVVSKTLNMEKFKQIKTGMTQKEVEKLLGGPNSQSSTGGNGRGARETLGWSQGLRITAYIKDGKVNGGGYMEGRLP